MRTKFTFLLVILGGILAGAFHPAIPGVIVSVLGAAGFVFGLSFYTSVYSGTVWGLKIKAPSYAAAFVLIGAIGLVIAGYGFVYTALYAFTSLLSGNLMTVIVIIGAYIITLWISSKLVQGVLENSMAKSNHAMVLEQFDLFKEIEANMGEATNFVVGFEGVALYSSTNYCYAVYPYENYGLGELTQVSEVAMVGSYFVQKYHDKFTFKVDEEVIPGEPGRTVVAVGAGGVSVGRVSGTADKRLFRSYIFTRNK